MTAVQVPLPARYSRWAPSQPLWSLQRGSGCTISAGSSSPGAQRGRQGLRMSPPGLPVPCWAPSNRLRRWERSRTPSCQRGVKADEGHAALVTFFLLHPPGCQQGSRDRRGCIFKVIDFSVPLTFVIISHLVSHFPSLLLQHDTV